MKIIKAGQNDLKTILKLQYVAYESEAVRYNNHNIPPLTQTLEQLLDEAKDSTILKAVMDQTIIGSVRGKMVNNTCKIGRLIVHPDFQRRGIGTQLLSEIELHFKDAENFELFTGADSEDNIRLYKKTGYHESKREKLTDDIDLVFLKKWA